MLGKSGVSFIIGMVTKPNIVKFDSDDIAKFFNRGGNIKTKEKEQDSNQNRPTSPSKILKWVSENIKQGSRELKSTKQSFDDILKDLGVDISSINDDDSGNEDIERIISEALKSNKNKFK